jgi:hypothetical protein
VWIFFDFFNSKASTHVTARYAFKRRTTSRLLLHHQYIITKVYINMVFINKKQPHEDAATAISSTRMDTCPLTVLLQGDTTSTTTSTVSDVEQLHRHTDITIVMASTTAHTILARLMCAR